MEVGHLERLERQGKPPGFIGQIQVGNIVGEIALKLLPSKRTENSPDYEVLLRPENVRSWGVRGAAWVKEFKDGKGQFFSITIDGPEQDAPCYVAAFPADEQPKETPKDKPAIYNIRWGRPRGVNSGVATTPAALDDEIPF